MNLSKSGIEEALRERFFRSRIFPAARTVYQMLFNQQKLANRRAMRHFYSQYIHRGDLVFDVGANVGVYTEIFSELGATVVAVEPNPRCCRVLHQLARRRPIHVEMCAAADCGGTMTLQVCENHLLSTLAEEREDISRRSPVHHAASWVGTIDVQVKTLDQLIECYGAPNFVKIDAEGFDDRVLRGMSFRPSALSFEYYRYLPEVAMRCLNAPVLQTGYVFSYVQGMDMDTTTPDWMNLSEFKQRLHEFTPGEDYGDVIARRV